MPAGKKSKKLDLDGEAAAEAEQRYGEYWSSLPDDRRLLAEKIVMLTEQVGGRTVAAEVMGVAPTTLDNYRQGKTQPKFLELVELARAADHPFSYLVSSMGLGQETRPESEENFINLPMYPERASAGTGVVRIEEMQIGFMSFEERWLRALGANPATSFLLTATGDSMYPTIPDGAVMICDGSRKEVLNGFVYAFVVDGDLIVKRVERLLNGTIDLISDNKERYPVRNYKASDVMSLDILGRILYVGRPL